MTPNERDDLYYAEATILKQISSVGLLLPPLSQQKGWRFSRSAAIKIAEGLILQTDSAKATTYLQNDPAGMLSFFALAQHYRDTLIPGPYRPEETEDQIYPFQNLCEWLLKTVERARLAEDDDESPVTPKDKRQRPPQWGG